MLKQLQALRIVDILKYLLRRTQSDRVGLMENRIMCRVDLITPVDVTDDQKIIQPHGDQFCLMSGRVCSQQRLLIHEVTVALFPARMILRYQERIEILADRDYGAHIVIDAERRASTPATELSIKIIYNALTDV